jgi:hypothetical protein
MRDRGVRIRSRASSMARGVAQMANVARAAARTAHGGDESGDAAVQRGWSGVGRTASVEINMRARHRVSRGRRPLRSANERAWQNDRRRRRQYQRGRQVDIIAKCTEILGETGRHPLPRRRRAADRIAGRTGGNRRRVGDTNGGQMNMAEGEHELTGQREQRQPSVPTGVRSEPPHRSRPRVG